MSTKQLTAALSSIAIVAVGVIAAGWLMNQFQDVEFISSARNGFDV